MKILFYSSLFYSPKKVSGGREKYLYKLITKMREDHEITLLIPKSYNLTIKGVKVYHFHTVPIPIINNFANLISLLFLVPYILKKEKPDVVSAFIPSSEVFTIFTIAKLFGIKTILNLRGVWSKSEIAIILRDGLTFLASDALVMNAKNLNKLHAERVFYLPPSIILGKKNFYIPNAVDTDFWAPDPSIEKVYDFVYLANISNPVRMYKKGFENLYKIMKTIESKFGVVLKGKVIGNYDEKLVKEITGEKEFSRYFEWKGMINNKKRLKKEILECKVFVLPSNSEGMPNALMEAMSLGMPSIAMNVGAVEQLITNGISGYVIEKGDIEGFAEKLYDLLNDEEKQKRFGENARKAMQKKYGWEKNKRLVETCYEKILNMK